MIQITIGTQSFTLIDEEVKALETDIVSLYDWIENAIQNKTRQVVDQIILEHTDKQPQKLTKTDKLAFVKVLELESALEKKEKAEKNL